MTDIKRLNEIIDDTGYTKTELAHVMGVSYPTLLSKLKGESEFKQMEISALKIILGLNAAQVDELFFAAKVGK